MKKRFRQADGTEVEVEGSPEELAEYERQIREGSRPASISKKKPVLRGAEVDGKPLTDVEVSMVRLHRLGLLPQREPVYVPYQPFPTYPPIWLEPRQRVCPFCGVIDCMQTHIWCETRTINTDHTLLGALTCSMPANGLLGQPLTLTGNSIEMYPSIFGVAETKITS